MYTHYMSAKVCMLHTHTYTHIYTCMHRPWCRDIWFLQACRDPVNMNMCMYVCMYVCMCVSFAENAYIIKMHACTIASHWWTLSVDERVQNFNVLLSTYVYIHTLPHAWSRVSAWAQAQSFMLSYNVYINIHIYSPKPRYIWGPSKVETCSHHTMNALMTLFILRLANKWNNAPTWFTCKLVCMYVCMCVCVCVYIYIYIYIYMFKYK